MHLTLATALLALATCPTALQAKPKAARGAPAAYEHHSRVTVDLPGSRVDGTDTVTGPWSPALDVRLRDGMELAARCGDRDLTVQPAGAGVRRVVVPRQCASGRTVTLTLTFRGRLRDASPFFQPCASAQFARISRRGAVLMPGSGWHPSVSDSDRFEIEAVLPDGWSRPDTASAGSVPGALLIAGPYAASTDGIALLRDDAGSRELLTRGRHRMRLVIETADVTHVLAPDVLLLDSSSIRENFNGSSPCETPVELGAASLASTLSGHDGKSALVIVPDAPAKITTAENERASWLRALGELAVEQGARLMDASDVTGTELDQHAVLVLGGVADNSQAIFFANALALASDVDVMSPRHFVAGDRRWRSSSHALLASAPHPKLAGASVTVYAPNSIDALREGDAIFDHPYETWVVLDAGRAVATQTRPPIENGKWIVHDDGTLHRAPTDASLLADIRRFTQPIRAGRDAGTAGSRATAEDVRSAWSGLALDSIRFSVPIREQSGRAVIREDSSGQSRFLQVVPGHEWLPEPEETGGLPVERRRAPVAVKIAKGLVSAGTGTEAEFTGLDLDDALAVVLDESSSPGATESQRVRDWLTRAKRRNAAGLLVVRPGRAWPATPELAMHAANVPADQDAELREAQARFGLRALDRENLARRPVTASGDQRALPLFFAGEEVAAALREKGGLARGARTWAGEKTDVRLAVDVERVQAESIVGLVPGRVRSEPAVLVTAPLDARGERPDGRFYADASRAAALAALVEIGRRLRAEPADRTVVLAALDATAWAHAGERELAADWTGEKPAIGNVVSLAALVGSGDVMLARHSKDLATVNAVRDALEAARLTVTIEELADIERRSLAPWSVPSVRVGTAAPRSSPDDAVAQLDADWLARATDALERAIRALASEAR